MRTVAVLLLLTLLIAAPLAGGEDKEAGAQAPTVAVRIIRLEVDALPNLGMPLERDEWTVLTEAKFKEVIAKLQAKPGQEARTSRTLAGGQGGSTLSVTLLNRVTYVQDFDVEAVGQRRTLGEPIMGALSEGVIADLKATPGHDGDAVVVEAHITVANLIRPIPEFTTTLGGKQVTIQLPELMVKRIRKTVRVPLTGGAVLRAGDTTWLVVTADASGASEPGVGILQPK